MRLLAAGLLACGVLAAASPAATDADGGSGAVRLRVLTLNIFYGGDELDIRTGDWCAMRRGCDGDVRQVVGGGAEASGADVDRPRGGRALDDAGSRAPSAGMRASGFRSSRATG